MEHGYFSMHQIHGATCRQKPYKTDRPLLFLFIFALFSYIPPQNKRRFGCWHDFRKTL